jgi:hypothetical protein
METIMSNHARHKSQAKAAKAQAKAEQAQAEMAEAETKAGKEQAAAIARGLAWGRGAPASGPARSR